MKPQVKSQVQSGLDLIRMGQRMIAEAEIDVADVVEAFNQDRNGDSRLMRQLREKPGFVETVMAIDW